MEPLTLRNLTILHQQGGEINSENLPIVLDFVNYISAYCSELKFTDHDVLYNDSVFADVFHLFEQNVLTKKYQIHE